MRPKRRQPIPRSERGAAMLAALCLAMVFIISLASYLAMCFTTLTISTRTVAMSHGSELAEAGIEQALYSLNNSDWSIWTLSGSTASATMTMTASGLSTSTSATPLNYGNGMTGSVTVTVQNYSGTSPSITSHALMTLPSYAGNSYANTTSATATYSAPAAPVTSAAPVFVNAVAATTGTVRFRSAGTADSYNSNPGLGTTYQNYSAAIAGYSAVIVSKDNTSSSATVRLNNAVVHGYASGYDPYAPTTTNWLSYSTNGKIVGPLTPVTTYIDSTRLETSLTPYQPLPTVSLPTSWSSLPGSASTDGYTLNRTCTLGSTTSSAPTIYSAGLGIVLSSSQVVTIQGPVVIISYGGLQIGGSGANTAEFLLQGQYASLQIFVEYGDVSIGGNGIVNSYTYPLPKKVSIMDTNNSSGSVTISTNQPFYGTIYLPNMPISVTSTNPVFYGSIVGYSVSFTNSPTIHYDLALRSPTPRYNQSNPMQYGAAFSYLSTTSAFTGLSTTVP